MGGCKWTWLLIGCLIAVGAVGCGQAASPLSVETGVGAEPINTIEAGPSSPEADSATTPFTTATPTPSWTIAPISPTQTIGTPEDKPTQVIQEQPVAISPTIPIPSDPTLQKLVMEAREDLAGRLAIEVDQIALVELKAVEWSDTSLGCPQPGMMYAQVITPGFLIILATEGQTYEYHADRGRVVTLCERASSSGAPSKGEDATVDDGWPNQPLGDDVIIAPPQKRK